MFGTFFQASYKKIQEDDYVTRWWFQALVLAQETSQT